MGKKTRAHGSWEFEGIPGQQAISLRELIILEDSPLHCWKPLQQHCPVECFAMMGTFQNIELYCTFYQAL